MNTSIKTSTATTIETYRAHLAERVQATKATVDSLREVGGEALMLAAAENGAYMSLLAHLNTYGTDPSQTPVNVAFTLARITDALLALWAQHGLSQAEVDIRRGILRAERETLETLQEKYPRR